MLSEKEQVQKCMYKFCKESFSPGKSYMCKHFLVRIPKSAIYHIINCYKAELSAENKKDPLRKGTKMTNQNQGPLMVFQQ